MTSLIRVVFKAASAFTFQCVLDVVWGKQNPSIYPGNDMYTSSCPSDTCTPITCCPTGRYKKENTDVCENCPAGSYANSPISTACTIYPECTLNEGDTINVLSVSCKMITEFTLGSNQMLKIKKDDSVAGEIIIDRAGESSSNPGRHFFVNEGNLEVEGVTLTGGFMSGNTPNKVR